MTEQIKIMFTRTSIYYSSIKIYTRYAFCSNEISLIRIYTCLYVLHSKNIPTLLTRFDPVSGKNSLRVLFHVDSLCETRSRLFITCRTPDIL